MPETNESGYLLSRRWIENVERAITPSPNAPESTRRTSLFYDVRPARIVSEWTQVGGGVWSANAKFVVLSTSDGSATLDESFPFNVVQYAPDEPSAPDAAQTVYVVWRGRWELVSSPPESASFYFGTLSSDWTQTETRDAPITVDGKAVYSPLSRYRDSLSAGARVVYAKIGNEYFLINAECPE